MLVGLIDILIDDVPDQGVVHGYILMVFIFDVFSFALVVFIGLLVIVLELAL